MSFLKNLLRVQVNDGRNFGLDLIRAFAALLVVHQHGVWILPRRTPDFIKSVQIDGVTIFFVLSGFLIGRILIRITGQRKRQLSSLYSFWWRRWLRTLPVYYAVLTVSLLLHASFGYEVPYEKAWSFYFFLQNFNWWHPDFFGVAWSLSVEEWFYLVFPASVFMGMKIYESKKGNVILGVAILFVLAGFISRGYKFGYVEVDSVYSWAKHFKNQVVTRPDAIAYGIIMAWLYVKKPIRWQRFSNWGAVVGIFILATTTIAKMSSWYVWESFYSCVVALGLECIGFALLLPFFVGMRRPGPLVSNMVTKISLISYSMYLLHYQIVFELIIEPVDWINWIPIPNGGIAVKFILYWVVTIVLSIVSYNMIELPVMEWRNKKFPS